MNIAALRLQAVIQPKINAKLKFKNMSTTSIGRQAETIAAEYLQKEFSLSLVAQNWRTRTCEIDLIMQKEQEIYFIEVKYRKNNFAGGGLQSITPTKLNQMELASQEFLEQNPEYQEHQTYLSAIELSGQKPKVSCFIESIAIN